MDTVKIGKFLSELRREQELTQEQLAEKLGTSNKTISRWENGNYMPPVEMPAPKALLKDAPSSALPPGPHPGCRA